MPKQIDMEKINELCMSNNKISPEELVKQLEESGILTLFNKLIVIGLQEDDTTYNTSVFAASLTAPEVVSLCEYGKFQVMNYGDQSYSDSPLPFVAGGENNDPEKMN